jgi:hypothetical protein
MALFTISFVLDKETKNTVKYTAIGEFAPCETLYLQKRDLRAVMAEKPYPHNILVTIALPDKAQS